MNTSDRPIYNAGFNREQNKSYNSRFLFAVDDVAVLLFPLSLGTTHSTIVGVRRGVEVGGVVIVLL